MTSQGGQLQPEPNGGDTLFQQTSIIPGIKMPNTTSKSRIGGSTLTSSEIAILICISLRESSYY